VQPVVNPEVNVPFFPSLLKMKVAPGIVKTKYNPELFTVTVIKTGMGSYGYNIKGDNSREFN
jgi:hypothetical protein